MPIFDTHGHLNLDPLYQEWQGHWQRSENHGVKRILVPGTTIETSKKALDIARSNKNIFAAVGIHPSEAADNSPKSMLSQLTEILETNLKQITAVGETGLDYYWLPDDESRQDTINKQKELFIGQINLANQHKLPISIHVRDKHTPEYPKINNAYWDTISLLEEHHDKESSIIMHCVSGPISYINKTLKMGAYLSFAGNVTYPNAKELLSFLKIAPTNKILTETDAPYLPPQDFRGKICEPWMISKTAEFVTTHKNITYDQLWDNAQTVFDLL